MFKLRERRAEYKKYDIPVVIGAFCGGIKEAIHEVKKIFKQGDLNEKDGEVIIRKILPGFVQTDFS